MATTTDILGQIDKAKVPKHIAIIMDGNGRWANQKGQERVFGHKAGTEAVRNATEAAAEIGVKYLTLYTFSTENWNRPKAEIDALMELLVETIQAEIGTLMKNNIRLRTIGCTADLPQSCRQALLSAMEQTANNQQMDLILALNYSARWEITEAVKQIAQKVAQKQINPEEINHQIFSEFLQTANIPDPELLIRTSGEYRISNFLLWQIAYAEFYFTQTFWPDFEKEDLYEAIIHFQQRERRFGKTGDQIKNDNV